MVHDPPSALLEDAVPLWSSCTEPLWEDDGEGHGTVYCLDIQTRNLNEQMENPHFKEKIQKEVSHSCRPEDL